MTTETTQPTIEKQEEQSYFDVELLSRTDLKDILYSPAMWKRKQMGLVRVETTSPMRKGTIVHKAFLEPEKLHKEYLIIKELALPSEDYAEVKGRKQWKIIKEEEGLTYFDVAGDDEKNKLKNETNAVSILADYFSKVYEQDLQIITPREYEQLGYIVQGLKDNDIVTDFLSGSIKTEVMLTGVINDIALKCQIDIMKFHDDGTVSIADYKSIEKALDLEELKYKRYNKILRYDMQSYIYCELARQNGYVVKDFKFLWQSLVDYEALLNNIDINDPNSESYECYNRGKIGTDIACEIFHRCSVTDTWPSVVDQDTGGTNRDQEFDF